MPGVWGIDLPPAPWRWYRADLEGQADTIRAIWAGETNELAYRLLLIGPQLP
jgi:hypothetical protein